jgi:hypothetical protein
MTLGVPWSKFVRFTLKFNFHPNLTSRSVPVVKNGENWSCRANHANPPKMIFWTSVDHYNRIWVNSKSFPQIAKTSFFGQFFAILAIEIGKKRRYLESHADPSKIFIWTSVDHWSTFLVSSMSFYEIVRTLLFGQFCDILSIKYGWKLKISGESR